MNVQCEGTTVYAKTPYETLTEATDASAGSSATGTNSAESSARRNTAADQQQYPIGLQSQGKQHGGGSARGGTNKQQGDGHGGSAPNAWKRASNLVIMQGDSNQTPSSVPTAADQPSTGKPMQTTAVIGGDQPQASTASDLPPPPPLSSTTTTTSARMGVRHSIAGRSPGVQGGCDARQLQKRTEAFEQLSAFLQ
jgi:hypothetical protein